MPEHVKKIRTVEGDQQIDYSALANLPSLNGEPIIEDFFLINGFSETEAEALIAEVFG